MTNNNLHTHKVYLGWPLDLLFLVSGIIDDNLRIVLTLVQNKTFTPALMEMRNYVCHTSLNEGQSLSFMMIITLMTITHHY